MIKNFIKYFNIENLDYVTGDFGKKVSENKTVY